MTPQEAFRSALDNLAAHKLRSALTMLGMIFGVGAVIAMMSIGAGAERQALASIERLGLRNVLVRAKSLKDDELQEIRQKSLGVSPRDAAAIAEAVPGIELVAPRIRIDPYKVLSTTGKSDGAAAYGVGPRHRELAHLGVAEGRFLDEMDDANHAQVCVVGPAVRRDLFGYGPAVGQLVKVNDVWLEVVGVLADDGAPSAGAVGGAGGPAGEAVAAGSTAREIYLPVSTAERKFEHPALASPLDEIVVRMKDGASGQETSASIRELLDRLHAGTDDYELVVPEALLAESRRTQRLFNMVMGAIAGISLLVGGIGIMNIMLATVLERTREIGVRRAVGARSFDIRFQFIVESFAISLIGGVTGIVAGLALARGVAAVAGWETIVTGSSILLSTGVAMTVGLASGIYPASRAASLDPIEALRYE
ncbi:MAG: putative transport system permease protein [Acidobacteriota bacterium]|jgi:putative ABC transport system permease protein|nr:putative transport system permease protein [Acidobacteriota bacterium]